MGGHKLFIFGLGYVGQYLGQHLLEQGWAVAGTTRTPTQAQKLKALRFHPIVWDGTSDVPRDLLEDYSHILVTIPPDEQGDIILRYHDFLSRTSSWVGYLSATSVYGDHQGAWVTEASEKKPISARGRQRLLAENQWLSLRDKNVEFPIHIFRLSGIYGPERSVLDGIRAGTAQRIDKPGHLFSRMHIEDIISTLMASMVKPQAREVYNLADDEPASTADLIAYGCQLLNIKPLPVIPFEEATISDTLREFYSENKCVCNDKIKESLGVSLKYPTYREGLKHC
jgi:nucleoside-diphosphate-sugar epimerase